MLFDTSNTLTHIGSAALTYSTGTFTATATRQFHISASAGLDGCSTQLGFELRIRVTRSGVPTDYAQAAGACYASAIANSVHDTVFLSVGDSFQIIARSTVAATLTNAGGSGTTGYTTTVTATQAN